MAKRKPEPSESQFITKEFFGTVILKDWITTLDDRQVRRITGICSLVRDVAFGADWGVRVEGHTRGNHVNQQWVILGCQILAVVAHGVAVSCGQLAYESLGVTNRESALILEPG